MICCHTSRCALVGWSVCSAALAVVFVVLHIACFVGQGSKPPTPCHGAWGPYTYLHRGNLNLAQENTAAAIVPGISEGTWSEMDVLATSDGTPHLFHDANALRLTGVDAPFADLSSSDLADGSIEILAEIDGHDYDQTARIPTAASVVGEICALDPGAAMDIDVKDAASAMAMASVLVEAGCDVGSASSGAVIAIGDPRVAREYRDARSDAPPLRLSLFLHPGVYGPLGLYFFLKTRLLHWYSRADVISAHYTVWDRDYDLIRQYEEDGYCSAVYGIPNSAEALARYPSASYYVVDEGPHFPENPDGQYGGDGSEEKVVYSGSRGGYIGTVFACFFSLFMCLVSLGMVYRNRHFCCTRESDSGSNTDNEKTADLDIAAALL